MLIACKNHNVINREIYSLFLAQSSAIEGVVSKSANESPNLPQLLLKNLIINLGKTTRYAPNASDMAAPSVERKILLLPYREVPE